MTTTLHYPRRDISIADVFNQQTFDRLTTHILSWRQSPGAIGGLHLHPCWGIKAVLERRYQGQTTYLIDRFLAGAMRLFDRTNDPRWRQLASDMASNILFLQTPVGGFSHAIYEFEPCYVPGRGGAIHQFLPVLALLSYVDWPHAEENLKRLIRPAIDRHWEWYHAQTWKLGNVWEKPLGRPGWCGVTNQDLIVVAALAQYARIYDRWDRYRDFGKPALDVYISEKFYHARLGMFERGDSENRAEPIFYNLLIVRMLQALQRDAGEKVGAVIDNTVSKLFDGIFESEDGLSYLAWGAKTDPTDKSAVTQWIRQPLTISAYPGLLELVDEHLIEHPNPELARRRDALRRTVAAWVYSDGTLPGAIRAADEIFTLSPSRELVHFWLYLMHLLGDKLRDPQAADVGCIHRHMGATTWKSSQRMWALEREGTRRFAGLKAEPTGIAIGPEGVVTEANFCELDRVDVIERID